MRSHPRRFLPALGAAGLLTFIALAVRPLVAENPGKQLFERRCTGCHALDNEKSGPHLRGVYGKAAGSLASFQYSDALRKSGVTWDSATLDKWLTDTDSLVPDNDMAFRVANADERVAIIGYLKEISNK
jgi:cytochrome c